MEPFLLEHNLGQFARSKIARVRWLLSMAILIMMGFMVIDLGMLPDEVKAAYIRNRLLYQVPVVGVMIALTWVNVSRMFLEQWFAFSVVLITVLNYYFIYLCWIRTGFAFPYEGTFVYALFLFFIMGIHARIALWVAIVNSTSFTALMIVMPIYGDKSLASAGFVVVSLLLACLARYQIDALIDRLDKTNARLETLSSTDQLTNLFNRRALMDRSEQLLVMAQRQRRPVSLFMIDLDHFKRLNDSYGHQVGDTIITRQAELLREVFKRDVDVIGRYGGEEFMVVVVDLNLEQTRLKAEAIVQAWQRECAKSEFAGPDVTCSVGACHCAGLEGHSLQQMIGEADTALYQAKSQGRNRFVMAPNSQS